MLLRRDPHRPHVKLRIERSPSSECAMRSADKDGNAYHGGDRYAIAIGHGRTIILCRAHANSVRRRMPADARAATCESCRRHVTTQRLTAGRDEVPFVRLCAECGLELSKIADRFICEPADVHAIDVERPVVDGAS